ncbi:helix-turn-helix transcriptional regulator [Ornithinimicrobium cavernae]|uniref:helix-turn-helix transcriptional regulator n=1 Tax=Ornithinimicrobium cavernae TaxID=2666047 RepID=UPI00137ABC77|nr:helix-turn-helix transcriptional regulator [Ornithinimicrobium cavernae]
MGEPQVDSGPRALTAGWAQLSDARWAAARSSFTQALALDESAEAFEGLAWAAWWLDDADGVFTARQSAFRLYRERHEDVAAARLAIWLASDNLDFRAAASVASGWLRRAHRLLADAPLCPEHGWLAFLEGYLAAGRGDDAAAAHLAAEATEAGRQLEDPDVQMLGLALEGAILVGATKVDEGMCRLEEATAMAGDATNPIAGGWACCFLVSACAAVLDLERAAEWCERIADFADRYGSRYLRAVCRAEYGTVRLWRGQWADAERLLESSVQDFARSRPAFVGMPLVALAELRRRQGRQSDVSTLLERAGASGQALLCQARLEFDRGYVRRSAELVERMVRQSPPERRVDHAPALEHLLRSRIGAGDLERAGEVLESLRELDRLVGTEPVGALTSLGEGLVAAASGDHEAARTRFEDAVDRFTRCGAPFEAARARVDLATSLVALDRLPLAEREAGDALTALTALGARTEATRARRLMALSTAPAQRGTGLPVTAREQDVLVLLAEGLTNREIAHRLVVSEHTVHRHVTNILRKLDLPSRTAAAALAVRSGWVH